MKEPMLLIATFLSSIETSVLLLSDVASSLLNGKLLQHQFLDILHRPTSACAISSS